MTSAPPTLLLTRPRPQADRFAELCRAELGPVDLVISPVLTIAPRPDPVNLGGLAGVVLSSQNAARVLSLKTDVKGLTAWCVGDRTAQVAAELGMNAISARGDATDLIGLVSRSRPDGPILHAHGAETRGDVAQRLSEAGLTVTAQVLYDQVETALSPEARAALAGPRPVVLPLFSPRSARLVGAETRGAVAQLAVVAISPAVAAAWTGPSAQQFTVAERPDAHHMIGAIATIWTSLAG